MNVEDKETLKLEREYNKQLQIVIELEQQLRKRKTLMSNIRLMAYQKTYQKTYQRDRYRRLQAEKGKPVKIRV